MMTDQSRFFEYSYILIEVDAIIRDKGSERVCLHTAS